MQRSETRASCCDAHRLETRIQVWQGRLVIVGSGDLVGFSVPEPRPTMCVCLSDLVCLLALVARRQALVSDRSCRRCRRCVVAVVFFVVVAVVVVVVVVVGVVVFVFVACVFVVVVVAVAVVVVEAIFTALPM
ncbi:unnamed protein product [Polarella glacialis]|uniref:Transmembrane protein n=1 Tax=Polarella glacialis TaxID=89957 RepID=A0A813HBR1_POLGL|nr:unnamed protein product [Polarella glacialis]